MSKSVLKWLLSIPAWPVWVVMVALVVVLAWQMWRGDALICADGSVFAKKCPRTGIGDGAVVAFDRDCPRAWGWRPYVSGQGRFIVGVGSHDGEVEQLARGSTGDRHEHETMWVTKRDGTRDHHRLTVKLGDAERNNMPPYIALELCVFGADSG